MPISPPKDESGNPVVDEDYVRSILERNPDATPQQVMDELVRSGIPANAVKGFAAGQSPSRFKQKLDAVSGPMSWMPAFGGGLGNYLFGNPQADAVKEQSDRRYQSFLRQILGGDGSQNPAASWWNSPRSARPRPVDPDMSVMPMY